MMTLHETLIDLDARSVRELNAALHAPDVASAAPAWRVVNPHGAHALACGIDAPIRVDIDGHAGYYCAGMNQHATVHVHGNAGTGVGETGLDPAAFRRYGSARRLYHFHVDQAGAY
jgi:glutamate synthase domain-containing protein 3